MVFRSCAYGGMPCNDDSVQVELAKKLVENSFADKVFFCNSGTEAVEAAIKFSRKYARVSSGAEAQDPSAAVPTEIVTFTNSFHGRTMGALALTAKTQYQVPFGPVMPGAVQVWLSDTLLHCCHPHTACRGGTIPRPPEQQATMHVCSCVSARRSRIRVHRKASTATSWLP